MRNTSEERIRSFPYTNLMFNSSCNNLLAFMTTCEKNMVHTERLEMAKFGVWSLHFVWLGLQTPTLNA